MSVKCLPILLLISLVITACGGSLPTTRSDLYYSGDNCVQLARDKEYQEAEKNKVIVQWTNNYNKRGFIEDLRERDRCDIYSGYETEDIAIEAGEIACLEMLLETGKLSKDKFQSMVANEPIWSKSLQKHLPPFRACNTVIVNNRYTLEFAELRAKQDAKARTELAHYREIEARSRERNRQENANIMSAVTAGAVAGMAASTSVPSGSSSSSRSSSSASNASPSVPQYTPPPTPTMPQYTPPPTTSNGNPSTSPQASASQGATNPLEYFAEIYTDEFDWCRSPSNSCNLDHTIEIKHPDTGALVGTFKIFIRPVSGDQDKNSLDYKVTLVNVSYCELHLYSSTITHGRKGPSSWDGGSVFLEPRESRESKMKTFSFDKEWSGRAEISVSGQLSDCHYPSQ